MLEFRCRIRDDCLLVALWNWRLKPWNKRRILKSHCSYLLSIDRLAAWATQANPAFASAMSDYGLAVSTAFLLPIAFTKLNADSDWWHNRMVTCFADHSSIVDLSSKPLIETNVLSPISGDVLPDLLPFSSLEVSCAATLSSDKLSILSWLA